MNEHKCRACGFELQVRDIKLSYLGERGLKQEAVCWSCGNCYGLNKSGVLDRLPLPWRVDSQHTIPQTRSQA